MGGFEVRDRPGPAQGEFTLHQSVVGGGTAVRLMNGLNIGLLYKAAMEVIYGDTDDDFGIVDVGAAFARRGWAVGAAVSNLAVGDLEGGELPTTARIGASQRLNFGAFQLLPALEGVFENGGRRRLHLGLEANWNARLFVRCGWMNGHDSRNYSLGLGAVYGRCRFDFALTPFSNELGTTGRFGVELAI